MSLRELLPGSVAETAHTERSERREHRSITLGSIERELWFVALAAMLVDVTLTVHGLQLGLREMNPVARAALDSVGIVGLYGLKAGAVCVGLCCRPLLPARHTGLIPLALAIPSIIAVGINSVLITLVVVS